ncbi:MAG TPA: molybdenum cofactor guanylyltransferase MobA [Hyphomicrobiaceae bacterium]|nr:molybdenum cofactor guanylyltransferase MobA [Hyphomicrobiaceae bacterium]
MTTAVILAGGLSRRMFVSGSATDVADKALLQLGGETMLDRVLRRIKPQVSHVVLNANGDPARFAALRVPVIPDPVGGYVGPLAGILAGMRWARANDPRTTHIVTVSSDVPFLPLDLVTRLATVAAGRPDAVVLAASSGETHSVIGCWPVAHEADLAARLAAGDRKVVDWARRHGVETVSFRPVRIGRTDVDPFFNANTPDELAEARRIVEGDTYAP